MTTDTAPGRIVHRRDEKPRPGRPAEPTPEVKDLGWKAPTITAGEPVPATKRKRLPKFDPHAIVREEGVPIPPRSMHAKRREEAPCAVLVRLLKVGESASIDKMHAHTLSTTAIRIGKEIGAKFVLRTLGDNVRIWRTK